MSRFFVYYTPFFWVYRILRDKVCHLCLEFEVMSHGGTERTEINAMSRRHRRCIERWSLFAISISNLYAKRLSQSIYQESVGYTSVALCAVGTSVTLRLSPSPP